MATKAKTEFKSDPISSKEQWDAWSKNTLETWADLAGKVKKDERKAVQKEFLDIVADEFKGFEDWGASDKGTNAHNYREWSRDMRSAAKLQGSAAKFCEASDATCAVTIYRTLLFQWGKPSERDEENQYEDIMKAVFTFDDTAADSYADQIQLWKEGLEKKLEKLPRFFPNADSRAVVVYSRLTNGMPKSFEQVCRECRTNSSIKTPEQVLKQLRDRAVELGREKKSEQNSGASYYTDDQIAAIKEKATAAGKKQGKKQAQKAAEKAADAFYANPDAASSSSRGGGKNKGHGKGKGSGKGKQASGPYAGGPGNTSYSSVYECSYCGKLYHTSNFCRQKKKDEEAAAKGKGKTGVTNTNRFTPDGRPIQRG